MMKHFTRGKLIFAALLIATIINDVIYLYKHGNPFNAKVLNFWGVYTGVTIGCVLIIIVILLALYVVYNWKTPIIKNK